MDFVLTGAKYKDECPVESMIPIYLIVLGAVLLIFTCCLNGSRSQSYNRDEGQGQSVNPLLLVMDLFIFAWFICGLVWICRAYEPNYDNPERADYCNKTLYLFAFWLSNSYLILNGVCLLIMCLTYTFIALFGNKFGNCELWCNCCWANSLYVVLMKMASLGSFEEKWVSKNLWA